MSGWQTVYLDTGDEPTARALALSLGSELPEGEYSAGDENYAFTAYTQWNRWPGTNGRDDEGEAEAGFYVLARFNTDRAEGLAAYNAVLATPYVVTPANPSNVWAGDSP
jgi:hypothetical protein